MPYDMLRRLTVIGDKRAAERVTGKCCFFAFSQFVCHVVFMFRPYFFSSCYSCFDVALFLAGSYFQPHVLYASHRAVSY